MAIYGDKDRVGLHCFAGCSKGDILASVGLTWRDILYKNEWLSDEAYKELQRKKKAEELRSHNIRIGEWIIRFSHQGYTRKNRDEDMTAICECAWVLSHKTIPHWELFCVFIWNGEKPLIIAGVEGCCQMSKLLDLFAGRLGWSKAFLAKGWEVVAYDLTLPSMEIPDGVDYRLQDILTLTPEDIRAIAPDFICASSPCEQFSVHGMRCFHKNPPYPEMGIKLFNHTRMLCESSGVPYVMENVRCGGEFCRESQ